MEWLGIKPFTEDPKVSTGEGLRHELEQPGRAWRRERRRQLRCGGPHQRDLARLEAKPRLSNEELWAIYRATAYADTNARYFVPFIAEATKNQPGSDPARRAAQILAVWNMENGDPEEQGSYQSPATTVMMTWLPIIYRELLADDLPREVFAGYAGAGYPGATQVAAIRPGNGSKLLYNALLGHKAGVPQTYDFFNGADKNAVIRSTLAKAMADLTARYGNDMRAGACRWSSTPFSRPTSSARRRPGPTSC